MGLFKWGSENTVSKPFDFSLDRPILEEYIDENFLKEVRQC